MTLHMEGRMLLLEYESPITDRIKLLDTTADLQPYDNWQTSYSPDDKAKKCRANRNHNHNLHRRNMHLHPLNLHQRWCERKLCLKPAHMY
jgi:hypothetical protein